MTKKDVIMLDKREELAEDHPFLRTELGQYAFQLGFDTATESVVEQAYKWLERYVWPMTGVDYFALTESFRKAMEE